MLNGILLEEMDMSNVCRTCLETGELVSIFNPCSTGPRLIEKLTSVTSGKLFDCVGLPTQICHVCICDLDRAYKFASKCHETDRKLREFIRNSNSQSENESATIMAGHIEKVGLDIMESRNKWINSINQRFKKQKLNSHNTTPDFSNSRSINVKINYDSDESEFGEMQDFHKFAQNNQIQNDFGYGSDGQQSSNVSKLDDISHVNRKRKMTYNDEILEKDIKSELTSDIDLGTTEFYMNTDPELRIKTEHCDSDYSLENYQNYLDQESQIFNTHFTKNYIEPEICNTDINLKPKNKNGIKTPINNIKITKTLNNSILKPELPKPKTITEKEKSLNSKNNLNHSKHGINTDKTINQNIKKEIPPNQEFDIYPVNIDKQIPPNQEHLNINEQTPRNQEFDVEQLKIDKQIPPNQEFDVNSLNIVKQKPPNQKFHLEQLNVDKQIPPNQEFDVNSVNIVKQKTPNQKFHAEQLNVDKQIPPNQEFDVNSVNIVKQKPPNQKCHLEQLNVDKQIPPNQEFDINSVNLVKQKPPNQKCHLEQLSVDKQIPPNQEFDVEHLNIAKQIPLNQKFNVELLNIDKEISLNQEFDVEPLNINKQIPPNQKFDVEPLNINKQIPLNQEYDVEQLNIDTKVPLNQEFDVEQLHIDTEIPVNQEFDVEQLNIDKQILLNQEFDLKSSRNEQELNSLNKKLELKLSKCGIYFEPQTIADIDLTVVDHSDFEEQMETLKLLKIPDDYHPEISDECDVFENSIQALIDQESVPMLIDDIDAKCGELNLDIKSEIDPLEIDESIDCELPNNSLDGTQTTKSNEIIYAEINIQTVRTDSQGNAHFYKINSNICTLNNKTNDNANNLNYQNVILKNSESLTSANYLHDTKTTNNTLDNGNMINKIFGKDYKANEKQINVIHKSPTKTTIISNKTNTKLSTNKLNKPLKTYSKLENLKNNNLENSKLPNNTNNIIDLTLSDNSNAENNTDSTVDNEENANTPNTEHCTIKTITKADIFNAKKFKENNRTFRQCYICLRYVRRLRKHIHMHNNKKNCMCEVCGEIFETDPQFSAHQKLHENDKRERFKCNICPKEFRAIAQLEKHTAAHKKRTDTCILCNEQFTKSQGHTCKPITEETRELEPAELKDDEIKCDKCDDVFTTIDTYNSHFKIHKKKITCIECDLHFGTKERLEEHAKSHKVNEPKGYTFDKPFSCEMCERKFTFYQQLVYHMKIHKNKKPTECPLCGEIFTQYQQFRRHNCTCTDCPNCDKSFENVAKLKTHLRIHRMKP